MKIAVTGKGGVGKTTIAGTLARLFARDGYNVIAIDADPAMNLKFALGIEKNPPPISGLRDLIIERTGAYSEDGIYKLNPRVDDILTRYGANGVDGLRLLVMGTIEKGGTGCVCPENSLLRALLRHLLFNEDTVIIDMDAGIEHLGRGTAKGVDIMLTVIEQGMRSVETASRIKKLGEDLGISKILAVINKVTDLERVKMIENKLDEIELPLLGTIPYDERLVEADIDGIAPLDVDGWIEGDAGVDIKAIKEKIKSLIL